MAHVAAVSSAILVASQWDDSERQQLLLFDPTHDAVRSLHPKDCHSAIVRYIRCSLQRPQPVCIATTWSNATVASLFRMRVYIFTRSE